MRMLEIFSSERTYLSVIPDANYVASLLEQILHYMVQKGTFTSGVTCLLTSVWIKSHLIYLSQECANFIVAEFAINLMEGAKHK